MNNNFNCTICGLALSHDVSETFRRDQLYTNAYLGSVKLINGNKHIACIEQLKLNKQYNRNE